MIFELPKKQGIMGFYIKNYRRVQKLLLGVFLLSAVSSCQIYRRSTVTMENALISRQPPPQFFVISTDHPVDLAWQLESQQINTEEIAGSIIRLSKPEATALNRKKIDTRGAKSGHYIMVYVDTQYALSLLDSTTVHLPLSKAQRVDVFEYDKKTSVQATVGTVLTLSALHVLTIILTLTYGLML